MGSFRLDSRSAKFFHARLLRFYARGSIVSGRLGRYGTLNGAFDGRTLRALWRLHDGSGWISLTFDPAYRSFAGEYGSGESFDQTIGQCTGRADQSSEMSSVR